MEKEQLDKTLPILLQTLAQHREVTGKATQIAFLKVICEVAIDLGHYPLAHEHAADSVRIARQIDSPFIISEPLRCLGLAACYLGDWVTAHEALAESIQINMRFARFPALLDGLIAWALLLWQQAQNNVKAAAVKENAISAPSSHWAALQKITALEILALAIHHPATAHIDLLHATRLFNIVKLDLPTDVVNSTLERGKNRQLEEVVQSILSENDYYHVAKR